MNTLTKCCHCDHLQMIDANFNGMEYTCEGCGKQAIYDDGKARVPCPFCSELVLHDARKCRFCGEYVDAALRESRKGLTIGDCVLALLAPLGLILGLLYVAEEKLKGWALLCMSMAVAGLLAALSYSFGFRPWRVFARDVDCRGVYHERF